MKKYYPYAIIVIGVILATGTIFAFQNTVKKNGLQQPVPAPILKTSQPISKPKEGLEVSSPCEGVSLPVCGEDKKTYASECLAKFLGVKVASLGMCPKRVIQ